MKSFFRCFQLAMLALGGLVSSTGSASELTVHGGYQFNSDFEVALETNQVGNGEQLPADDGASIRFDDGASLGVSLDFDVLQNPNQRVGLYLSHTEGSFGDDALLSSNDMTITHLHLTGLSYYPNDRWEPFAIGGIGATFFSPDDSSLEDDTRFSFQLGGGANYRLSENLLIRLDARWFAVFFDSGARAFCSGGCVIAVDSDIYSQFQVNAGLAFRF